MKTSLPSNEELLEELRAVRSHIDEAITRVSDDTQLYVASTRLSDWLGHQEVITFTMTDSPVLLVAGSRLGSVRPGTILYATREIHRQFNYEPARLPEPGELTGRHVNVLVPPHLREKHAAYLAQFFEEPRTRTMGENIADLRGYTKDGKTFLAKVALRPRTFDSRVVVLVTVISVGDYEPYVCSPDVDQKASWGDVSAISKD